MKEERTEEWEPWKAHPDIWPTEASFWQSLREGLRAGLWHKSLLKQKFKKSKRSPPPPTYHGRGKVGAFCALGGGWELESKMEVDHIAGEKSLLKKEDILPFVQHLIPMNPEAELQVVTKRMHAVKTYAERYGLSFEDALIEKNVIAIISKKQDKKILLLNGITPGKNLETRRAQLREHLKEVYRDNPENFK